MDPLSTIVAAVVAGAATGLGAVAAEAVKDAYAGLRKLIVDRYADRGDVADALDKVEARPDSQARQAMLREELAAAGAEKDAELLTAAQALLAKIGPDSASKGSTIIQQQAGDNAVQIAQARDVTIGRKD